MIHWMKPVMPRQYVVAACCLAIVGLFLVHITATNERPPYYKEQVLAAQLMQESLDIIRQEKLARNIPIDRLLDPNETGLIGEEFTEITTSLGNLESKRTSTNPSFAALLVRLFHEADLSPGATVAIGASGSFPGLIVATLAACQAMELKPLLFYSVGASMYGANIPGFTFIEMLDALHKSGLFSQRILAVSLGSDNDRGDGMFFPESRETMMEIARSAGAVLICPEGNGQSIQQRMALYLEYNDQRLPDLFVNVGGASPNMGNTNASLEIPSGLVTKSPLETDHPERGLVFEYLDRGVPAIHLLNIRDLALKSGLAIDPVPLPPIGTEDVYYVTAYNPWLIWGSVVLTMGLVIWGRKFG